MKAARKTTRKKRGSYNPEGMKKAILDCAIQDFSKNGFFQTSFDALAKKIGCSQSAVMNHYPSKIDLIGAVVAEVVRRSHAWVSASESPSDDALSRLHNHFDQTAEWAIKNPDEGQILILLYYMGAWNKEFQEIYLSILKTARERILSILLAGEREGKFKTKGKSQLIAETLHDFLLGTILNELASGRPKIIPKAFFTKKEYLFKNLVY